MIAFPAVIPVTTPDVASTVATVVLSELHTPPGAKSTIFAVEPAQSVVAPEIVPSLGIEMTEIFSVAEALPQEFDAVYEAVAVPTVIAITTPVAELMAATVGSLIDHTPPKVSSVNAVTEPVHMVEEPLIGPALARAKTVSVWLTVDVPQEFETL